VKADLSAPQALKIQPLRPIPDADPLAQQRQ